MKNAKANFHNSRSIHCGFNSVRSDVYNQFYNLNLQCAFSARVFLTNSACFRRRVRNACICTFARTETKPTSDFLASSQHQIQQKIFSVSLNELESTIRRASIFTLRFEGIRTFFKNDLVIENNKSCRREQMEVIRTLFIAKSLKIYSWKNKLFLDFFFSFYFFEIINELA